jgi:hypothetical protein
MYDHTTYRHTTDGLTYGTRGSSAQVISQAKQIWLTPRNLQLPQKHHRKLSWNLKYMKNLRNLKNHRDPIPHGFGDREFTTRLLNQRRVVGIN